jgi:threonine dehydrogenase-like Zn-dependent dehydrogenase
MKAVVFHDVGDIRLDDVPAPTIEEPTDAVVRLTASAICGTDLHMVRGTLSGMAPGTILGHEGVGIVEDVGRNVRNLQVGDRVVIPSTIACGTCSYCRDGYFSQCDRANPNGPSAGKNLTIQMGNCNHRRYIPSLIRLIQSGAVDPLRVLTQHEPMTSAIAAYEAFDERRPGWMKVELRPAA